MKFLLLYASLGAGHKRAAQALEEALRERGIPVECRDLLDFLPWPMPSFYSHSYTFMITRSRWLWKLVYNTMDRGSSPYRPARARTQKWQFRRLLRYLKEGGFSAVISTHFTPSALLCDWRKDHGMMLNTYSVITDFVAHRCWLRNGQDHYFVACEAVSEQLRQAGIALEKIAITGIPISSAFHHLSSREEARRIHSCKDNELLVLILCSALNTIRSLKLLTQVAEIKTTVRFLVSAGADSNKEKIIKEQFKNDPRFQIFGFSTAIAEMMQASDLIISKPGGLTVSESLAVGLPQILLSPIPGQEEGNARFATAAGAAICVDERHTSVFDVLAPLLENEPRLRSMRNASLSVGRPNSAAAIIDAVLAQRL